MAASRMQGKIGFNEDIVGLFTPGDRACMRNILPLTSWPDVRRSAREILRRLSLASTEADHMPMGRSWPQADIDRFSNWIDEATPKVRGETYSSYFRELDSVSEYFDVYGRPAEENIMPDVMQYFGDDIINGRRKALKIWRSYAALANDDPSKPLEKQSLDQELAHAEVANAIKRVDSILIGLMKKYFFNAGALDLEILLEAFVRFGADRLPEDVDRLTRIQNLNDPDDFRLSYAKYHRMDSQVMWMNWMGHVECATILYGPQDSDHALRTALMAALCLGYSADAVFRHRGQTRPEYYGADGEDRMWRKSVLVANDASKAIMEAHLLAGLRQNSQPAAILALDTPVRFNDTRDA